MHRLSQLLVSLLVAGALASPTSAFAVVVDSADDVCAPAANPCVVSQPIDVAAGSHLDFGLRMLVIDGAGVLDFDEGRGSVSCGRLEAETTGPAIRARAESSPAATLTIHARRRCSMAALPCFVDADCAGAGACSSGDGAIELRGGILANADAPGHVVVRSAGDLAIHGAVSIAGARAISDGGSLTLESTRGSVLLAGAVDVSGGGGGGGGDVSVTALADVSVHARIDATGGEYDGGSVSLDAGRDVSIEDDVAVDATSGAGAGGEIDVLAGRDIVMSAGTASNTVVLSADGHQSAENDAGDGGTFSFEADGSIRIGRHVRFAASAAAPDGFADSLSFAAEQDLDIDAPILAKGRGTWGGGALVDLYAGRSVRVGPNASFDLVGSAAGGDLMVEAGGVFVFEGSVDVSGGPAGIGGRIVTVSGGDSEVAGEWTTAGRESEFAVGEVFVEGCRVRVDGRITNGAEAGRNRFVVHDALVVTAAASVVASGEGGTNAFLHRGAAGTPLLAGSVAPVPSVVVDDSLAPCALCVNAEGEDAEGCDDANVCTDDLCDGAGSCVHVANEDACDDADFCTTGERCQANACGDDAARPLVVARLRSKPGEHPGEDQLMWKASVPAGRLPAGPASTNVRVVLSDALSRALVDVTLPAGALVRERASWRFRSSGDEPSFVESLRIDVARRDTASRVRSRLGGLDLSQADLAQPLRLALLFGDEPGEAACLSSAVLECRGAKRRIVCATPR
jgi:hypothetical protein